MQDAKTIFVTGATGNQGGAVVKSLLNNGFKVKALTRNPVSPASKKLNGLGAEVVKGDLNDPSGFRNHLSGTYGIFCALTFANGINEEIDQGIRLANLAKSYNISHFLYSSVIGADLQTGIPHWDSKLIIEKHIRQLHIPFTIVRPASLFENFLIPAVKQRILKGTLISPVSKNVLQQFIGTSDIGDISSKIFLQPEYHIGRTYSLYSEKMNLENASFIFSKAMGRKVKYQKMPMILARMLMGRNLSKMFRWLNMNYDVLVKDTSAARIEFPNMLGLGQWIELYFKNSKQGNDGRLK